VHFKVEKVAIGKPTFLLRTITNFNTRALHSLAPSRLYKAFPFPIVVLVYDIRQSGVGKTVGHRDARWVKDGQEKRGVCRFDVTPLARTIIHTV
jgi:hypothetical protein